MNYGIVQRDGNTNADGVGIGGGVAGYEGMDGHVTFYVEVPDVEAALAKAESLGGTRIMGPDTIIGHDRARPVRATPRATCIGVVKSAVVVSSARRPDRARAPGRSRRPGRGALPPAGASKSSTLRRPPPTSSIVPTRTRTMLRMNASRLDLERHRPASLLVGSSGGGGVGG